ncbi:MAG: DUF1559 domain-containing protein [Planctomycetota bacterium]
MIPVLGSARGEARAIACGSNLRQLGIANASYAADHDGTFAAYGLIGNHYAGWWTETLAPYIQRSLQADRASTGPVEPDDSDFNVALGGGAVLRCPDDDFAFPKLFGPAVGVDHVGESEGWLSYAMNSGPMQRANNTSNTVDRYTGVGGNRQEMIPEPSVTAHHIDAAYIRYVSDHVFLLTNPFIGGELYTGLPDERSHYTTPSAISASFHRRAHEEIMGDPDRVYRHGGKMNVLFADGHVERHGLLPGAEERPEFWGPVYLDIAASLEE